MIRFTTLGDVDLRAEDGAVLASVLNQPRRLALLAYLAIESAQAGIQRDRLLVTFWPELPQTQARQALRTALHFLRRSLGPDAFEGQSTWVALNRARVSCDAADFRSALAGGDGEAALRVYAGDLLPGFHLEGGPVEFERWLEEVRGTLRREAAEAAWTQAEAQERLGNAAGAGAWARRASVLSQSDEPSVRRAIELLGRVGDRAGALDLYRSLARRLQDDFDAEPSGRTQGIVAAIRAADAGDTQGVVPARPAAPRAAESRDPLDPGREHTPAPTGRPAPRGVRKLVRTAYSAGVSALLALAFYSLWGANRGHRAASMDGGAEHGPVIHVAELRDFSADPGTANLAGALTVELMGRLSEPEALRVVPVQSIADASPGASRRPAYVVSGGVIRMDSVLRITAILSDGASGATLDRIGIERATAGLDLDEAAETMARMIRRQVGRAVHDHERGNNTTHARALALVREAVREMEAGDSLAGSGVVEAANLAFEAADSQLALAQAAAPRWAEPSVLRAEVAYRRAWAILMSPTLDRAGVGTSLRAGTGHADRAIALAADDPSALEIRGLLHYWLWLTRSGDETGPDRTALARAEGDLRRATTLDAGRGRAWSTLSAILENRGDFAAANLAAGKAYRSDPYLQNTSEILLRLFNTSLELDDRAAARQWCDELSKRSSNGWLTGYCTLTQLAWYGPPSTMDHDALVTTLTAAVEVAPDVPALHAQLWLVGAVALARAGSPHAYALIDRAKTTAEPDPHLMLLEAWARLVLEEEHAAADLMTKAVTQNGDRPLPLLKSQRFELLRTLPLRGSIAGG